MQEISQKDLSELYKSVKSVRGGIKEIARRAQVRREWVWLVLTGQGKSARIIKYAQCFVQESTEHQ